ncbi:MAPEG family protein [Sphingobium subterraneum]|uniref:MAPEG family protein n=1 Tax=Sphingobium subterraneum TaxID=627688 RepID=A0A841J0J2_9SPHN|nr:MAPEG family protein [Sphingobium subterraneum]MBB6123046.1 hypothetical protein [Sphingobium subterraneum]
MSLNLSANLLVPAIALVLWSLTMLIWMVVVRFPAMKAANINLAKAIGGRGQDLEKLLPPAANWPAHNYAHLMEQPTIFYPTILVLAVLGQGSTLNLVLAWAYVAIRIVHSVWQVKVNAVPVRARLFLVSSLVLVVLAVNALRAAIAAA